MPGLSVHEGSPALQADCLPSEPQGEALPSVYWDFIFFQEEWLGVLSY